MCPMLGGLLAGWGVPAECIHPSATRGWKGSGPVESLGVAMATS